MTELLPIGTPPTDRTASLVSDVLRAWPSNKDALRSVVRRVVSKGETRVVCIAAHTVNDASRRCALGFGLAWGELAPPCALIDAEADEPRSVAGGDADALTRDRSTPENVASDDENALVRRSFSGLPLEFWSPPVGRVSSPIALARVLSRLGSLRERLQGGVVVHAPSIGGGALVEALLEAADAVVLVARRLETRRSELRAAEEALRPRSPAAVLFVED